MIALKNEIYKIELTPHSIKRGKERGVTSYDVVNAIKKASKRIKALNSSEKNAVPFAIIDKSNDTAIIAKKEQQNIFVLTVLKNKEFQIENIDRVIYL